MGKFIDLTNLRVGKLKVLYRGPNRDSEVAWVCLCDCGTITNVKRKGLRAGDIKSCGCLRPQDLQGMSNTKLYTVWSNMIARCNTGSHTSSKYYNGKGIKVCKEWHNSSYFLKWATENGYAAGLQIDRIDNDGDYEPSNCRFVSPLVNHHNQGLLRSSNKSGFAGVIYRDHAGKFVSRIRSKFLGPNHLHLGYFDTALEAAIVRDKFIVKNKLPNNLQVLNTGRENEN